MTASDSVLLLNLYLQIAPGELFRLLQRQLGARFRNGIYSARLVIWMMMSQRWQVGGTLASSVEQLVQGRFDPLLSQCKRVRDKKIALSTGGYCQARQNLPKLLVSHSVNELIERLRSRVLEGQTPPLSRRVYVLDGSSLRLEACPELIQHYPPAPNQHGTSHWPVIRMVVVHDLETGLAERPYWGAMFGPDAVSEQALADLAIEHVPAGSVMMGDRNFGVFSTAYACQQRGHAVLLRLTKVRAESLVGGPISREGDYPVCWRASRWDKGRGVLPEAKLAGRLVAWRVGRGKYKQWLYLFTTLALPAAEIVLLYGRRWNIETDLRSLKQTVRLHHLPVHSLNMMEKELLVAVMAYNLVRAVMCLAARQAAIAPRQLSFTYARNIVLDGIPNILAAGSAKEQAQALGRMIELVSRCKLPSRSKHRSCPRAVWSRGFRFRTRRSEN
jgi:hypothetical protein